MLQYETYIFPNLFDAVDKRQDINKDVDNKGTNERYNECLGYGIDADIAPYADNLLKNIYNPDTVLDKYVVYLESMLGFNRELNTLYIRGDLPTRRRILRKILKIYQIKGTKKAYKILFGWLGMGMTISEIGNRSGFDNPDITFDDTFRRFDSKCAGCSTYSIALTGSFSMTQEIQDGILSIIRFNNPINAILTEVTYNGGPLVFGTGDFNSDYSIDFF